MKKILLVMILTILISGCAQNKSEQYSVSSYGLISYTNRNSANYTKAVFNSTDYADIYKISYRSRDATIYALLSIPKSENPKPAFLVLPAAGVTKEGEQMFLSQDLNKMGFITLTLDTRGQGESIAIIYNFNYDYNEFKNGREPVLHRMVYDALLGFDILKNLPEVDKSKIYIAGESAGGRYAVIAAAIEPDIKGLLLISTSGYEFSPSADADIKRFENSINPTEYISHISPRPVIQMHSVNDKIIDINYARKLYNRAKEPKKFLEIYDDTHGYYRKKNQKDLLEQEIESWL